MYRYMYTVNNRKFASSSVGLSGFPFAREQVLGLLKKLKNIEDEISSSTNVPF